MPYIWGRLAPLLMYIVIKTYGGKRDEYTRHGYIRDQDLG